MSASSILVALCGSTLAPSALASSARSNPLSEVLSLLNSLAAKITKDGEAESKSYKTYVEWCDDVSKNTGFSIKTLTAKRDQLEATIEKLTGDAAASDDRIAGLANSVATDDAELNDASVIREKEAKEFAANEAELVDAIDTLSRAISALEREMAKNPSAFAQLDTLSIKGLVKSLGAVVDAASFSGADQKKLLAMVQSQETADSDDEELSAPAAASYETHSGNIFDVLEDLKEKAEEQLAALRKSEVNTKHNFQMLRQSLTDQIAADTKALNEEKASKASSEEGKATAEGDLAGTVKDVTDANSDLATAHTNCMQTAADHEATVNARTQELKVLAEAKQILQSSTSGAESQTYSMLQVVNAVRVGSSLHTRSDLANAEVVNLVKQLAQKHHSAALAQLASRISAVLRYSRSGEEDPFGKVRDLITDLINKLESQAQSDATEKAYCDEQMQKTEVKKDELEDDIVKLTTKIDQAAAASAQLKAEVKTLQEELAALARMEAEMGSQRAEAHANFVQAKADLEAGLDGVRRALNVLRDYYGGATSAASASLAQQPAQPELHEQATGAGSSIIGILEVVESDFATNLAKEEMAEADAQAENDRMTQENSVTRTLKTADVKYKSQEFTGLDKKISDLTSDRETDTAEQSAVLEYYAQIKSRCIAVPETYEERKARREAEVAGLKEALSVLENETAFMQRKRHGRHGFLGA